MVESQIDDQNFLEGVTAVSHCFLLLGFRHSDYNQSKQVLQIAIRPAAASSQDIQD